MVTIVSRHSSGFPGMAQKITGGPLYESDILNIIASASIIIGTRRCRKDMTSLSKDEDDIRNIIKDVVINGKFHQSEWCQLSQPDTWAACDSYKWTERTWIEAAHREMDCDFYIKFCIGNTGNVVITISYHSS